MEDTFDIFRGTGSEDAVWLEAVEGREKAVRRLKEIARATPGSYFVFDAKANVVIESVDTRHKRRAVKK